MGDELTNVSNSGEAEKNAVTKMVKASVALLRKVNLEGIDAIALIINDHEGPDKFATELWINDIDVVNDAVRAGIPRLAARWLYEHWLPEAAKGEILVPEESPTKDRSRYYSLAVEAVDEIRKQVPELENVLFLVDNNHDYDSLVVNAITEANPRGQAAEWLAHPPPDC